MAGDVLAGQARYVHHLQAAQRMLTTVNASHHTQKQSHSAPLAHSYSSAHRFWASGDWVMVRLRCVNSMPFLSATGHRYPIVAPNASPVYPLASTHYTAYDEMQSTEQPSSSTCAAGGKF